MHVGRHYTLKQVFYWTRREIYALLLFTSIPTVMHEVFHLNFSVPWLPIALIGTAVAFVIGFKNNATYSRLWEARQIWGGIVNSSRAWGMVVKDYIRPAPGTHLSEEALKKIHQRLIYRHVAWLTALRFQLREPRAWENLDKVYNSEFRAYYSIPEHETKLEDELKKFLSLEDMQYVLAKKNRATHLISMQSKEIRQLKEEGLIDQFGQIELENILVNLYEHQGKCERIKNFPYPRQFATLNLYFVCLFTLLVPFGMIQEFEKLGGCLAWLSIPFSTLVCWVFLTMEKIGEATENPFEGTANDIPMASLSRTIEIDLREMLEEKDLPPPVQAVKHILM